MEGQTIMRERAHVCEKEHVCESRAHMEHIQKFISKI
jgi:hypothetical protein